MKQVIADKIKTGRSKEKKIFNPFPGLRPFSIEESHLFFGREGQSEEVLKKLADKRFVAVVGASGSGKSSLIYCGLIPILYGGFITDAGSKWRIIKTRPGNKPIDNLVEAIVKKRGNVFEREEDLLLETGITKTILRSSSLGLVEVIKQQKLGQNENILLLVDQFEELFRFKKSRKDNSLINESEAFVKLIVKSAKQTEIPIYVVLTMRSDFIGDCSQFQDLTDLINESNYLIPQMSRDNFRDAIIGPVAVGGGKIDPHLVQQLLNEVGDNPDQLPILQHSLMRTWDYWIQHGEKEKPISITDYIAIGRMEYALSEHANEAYDELREEGRRICGSIFKTLTERGSDNRGIRHPSSVEEIALIANTEIDLVIDVIEKFRASGRSFLTASTTKLVDKDTIIDISHESLMRIWNRLKLWVEEEAASVQMYNRLAEAAELYQAGKTGLWRPPDLQMALGWREKQNPTLSWAQRYNPAFERTIVYLNTSERAYIAEEQNKIKLQKKALRRAKIFALVLGSATVISLGLTIWAFVMQTEADKQKQKADKQSVIANDQRLIAEKKSKEAEQQKALALEKEKEALKQKDEAEKQKTIALVQTTRAVKSAEEALKQKEIANQKSKEAIEQKGLAEKSAKEALEQKIIAEKASTEAYNLRMLSTAKSMAVKSLQIDKDKDLKALLSYQAYIFNIRYSGDKQQPDIYSGLYATKKSLEGNDFNLYKAHNDAVKSLAFSPKESNIFYSAGSDGKVIEWDIKDSLKNYYELSNNKFVYRVLSISKDGKYLAAGTEESVLQLFDLEQDNPKPNLLNGHKGAIWALTFSPDNNYLVSASADSTILLWNLKTLENNRFAKLDSRAKSIAVSSNGKYMCGAFEDGKIILWNKDKNYEATTIYNDSKNIINAIAINKEATLLAIGDKQGKVMIWDLEKSKMVISLGGQISRISDLKFSNDGKLLASASYDGTVQLWETSNLLNQPVVFKDHESWVLSIEFNKDDSKIVTGCSNGQIKLWETNIDNMVNDICKKINRNLTTEEWNTYVGKDIKYEKTCNQINN